MNQPISIESIRSISTKCGKLLIEYYSERVERATYQHGITLQSQSNKRLIEIELLSITAQQITLKHDVTTQRLIYIENCLRKYPPSTIEDLITILKRSSNDPHIRVFSFSIAHWKQQKHSAIEKFNPRPPPEEAANAAPTYKMQLRVLRADETGVPLLMQYLKHGLSPEGIEIRSFATKLNSSTDPNIVQGIQSFIETQRASLVSQIKSTTKVKQSKTNLPPADLLRHSREGEGSLLYQLSLPESQMSPEVIDFAIEEYLYQLAGEHVFNFMIDSKDETASENSAYFQSASPEQFNISPALLKSGSSLFNKTINYLKEIQYRKSPTSKLIAVFRAIESLLQEINDKTGVRAGVDDFTDPLVYCCLKANIFRPCTQVQFMSKLMKKRLMSSAIGSHFVTFQLVIEHIGSLSISEELQRAMQNHNSVAMYVSVHPTQQDSHNSQCETNTELIPSPSLLTITSINESIPCVESVGNPIQVFGYKSYVIPQLAINSSCISPVVIVQGEPTDYVVLHNVVISEGTRGSSITKIITELPGIVSKRTETKDGILYVTDFVQIPEKYKPTLIPVTDMALEQEDVLLMSQLAILDGQSFNTLDEHHRSVEQLYSVHAASHQELISIIISKACKCFKKLDILNDDHPENKLDITIMRAFDFFRARITGDYGHVSYTIQPNMLKELTLRTQAMENGMSDPVFGCVPGTDFRITLAILQFFYGLPITGKYDVKTANHVSKLVKVLVIQRKVVNNEAIRLQKMIQI